MKRDRAHQTLYKMCNTKCFTVTRYRYLVLRLITPLTKQCQYEEEEEEKIHKSAEPKKK